jgi:response regulator RpfG family c-di-GMP phosphodiesterase
VLGTPYYTDSKNALGLLGIRERAALIGGNVDVAGAPGEGHNRYRSSANAQDSTTRILIVDDHAVVRDGVKRIIEEHAPEAVMGEAATPEEALASVREQDWDAVVLDISFGDKSGLEVLADIKRLLRRAQAAIDDPCADPQHAFRGTVRATRI